MTTSKIHPVLGLRVARNMAKIRAKRKLTQGQLAKMAGISQPYINQIEGETKPNLSLNIVEKIALALGVDPAVLMKE